MAKRALDVEAESQPPDGSAHSKTPKVARLEDPTDEAPGDRKASSLHALQALELPGVQQYQVIRSYWYNKGKETGKAVIHTCSTNRVALLLCVMKNVGAVKSAMRSSGCTWNDYFSRSRWQQPPAFQEILSFADADLRDFISQCGYALESEHEGELYSIQPAPHVNVFTAKSLFAEFDKA